MRNIYIGVAVFFLVSLLLFIGSFVYLDKEKHSVYYYSVNLDGRDIGSIRIDKFVTEDKLLYKSISNIPLYPVLPNSKSKIVLNKKYNLENYTKENFGNGAEEIISLENKENNISFVSVFESLFACLNKIPVKEGTLVFEEDNIMTYLPILENYDFKMGRSQGFNSITPFSISLPPMKRFVTLTSVRDEYITLDSKKVKAEVLLLKIKNYPQGIIWVSKLDRSPLMLKLPARHLKITRTFLQKTNLEAKEYELKSYDYAEKEIIFKNKNIQLSGTLTVPKKEGKHPAILLLWGSGPQDRQYQGFFTSLADYLSKGGFCVLRFDRRGIGSSEGDFSSVTDSDELEDVNAALGFLAAQQEVDPQKIAMLGHAKGAFYASQVASEKDIPKAFVLMAPLSSLGIEPEEDFRGVKRMASKFGWSDDYTKLVMKSNLETMDKVKNARHNWVSVSGKRCFVKKIKEEMGISPVELIKKIQIPVLILQGKTDESVEAESASILDNALQEGGNKNHTLTYFGYLGHFLGKRVNDGIHKIHYEVDSEVLEAIKNWLNKNLNA